MTAQTVLSVHNFYQHPGGEDIAYRNEATVLERHGHTVIRYEEHNSRISRGSMVACKAIWNPASYRNLESMLQNHPCDVVHFHNTFPLISPAAYFAVRRAGIPIVQTLHNYRLLCPAATFFRSGKPCEECPASQSLLPAVAHGCYRGSRAATAAVVAMLGTHRIARTWQTMVDLYIAPSVFARRRFIEGGLPADRIAVKPNSLPDDPRPGEGGGDFALYVGRLSDEKGARILKAAWRSLPEIPLRIAGEGALKTELWPDSVTMVGQVSRDRVFELMRRARVLIVPSICYEVAPTVLIEALACGLPVIASDLGAIPEFVRDGVTGKLFVAGDSDDLVRKVRWAFSHPASMDAMRVAARREFDQKYQAERNYQSLMEIYDSAICNFHRRCKKSDLAPVLN